MRNIEEIQEKFLKMWEKLWLDSEVLWKIKEWFEKKEKSNEWFWDTPKEEKKDVDSMSPDELKHYAEKWLAAGGCNPLTVMVKKRASEY